MEQTHMEQSGQTHMEESGPTRTDYPSPSFIHGVNWAGLFDVHVIGSTQNTNALFLMLGLTEDTKYVDVLSYIAKNEPFVVQLYRSGKNGPTDYHRMVYTSITHLKENIQHDLHTKYS